MIVEMVAVLAGELAEAALGALLDVADSKPERFNTPEKQKNLKKVQEDYSVLMGFNRQRKQNLKDLL